MKISSVGANQTEVTLTNGDIILISYQSPMAIITNTKPKTAQIAKWYWDNDNKAMCDVTKTTKKHIASFLARYGVTKAGECLSTELQTRIDNDSQSAK